MSFLNGLYEATDIQLNGENSVSNNTTGGAEFYLISTLGENFVIYVDGTSVFVLNSSTGELTISTPINITSTFSVNGVPTTPAYTKGTNNLGCGNGVFNILGTGSENVAYGGGALSQVITGAANTAIGYSTLQNLQAGNSNVSIGSSSGSSTSSGSNNIFIGAYSGSYIFGSYECNDCTLLGHGTRASIAGLSGSTCIGINSYITASNQIAIGSNAESIIFRGNVDLNAGGGTATATTQALLDNTTKVATTAFTQSAINRLLYLNTTSGNQMFFNVQFPALTTGYRNLGIGDCFRLLTSGGDNCCIGSLSLNKITTGTENFCLGGLSMREVTSGSFNVSVGVQNLANMTTATGNIAIGRYVMGGLTSGGDNCGIGYFNTVQITSGSSNTAIGPYANFHLRTGNNNTAIGNFAGAHDGGSFINASNNTYVGTDAKMSASSTTYSNSTCLGYNSRITASNGIFLGTATETTYPIGGLNIPTGTLLTLVGNIFANSTTITPSKLSLLSFISGGIVDTGTVGQQVGARKDFNGYDTFIAESIQEWLNAGRKLISPILTSGGWEKQFRQKFGEIIHGFISEYWDLWIKEVTVTNTEFNRNLENFMLENNSNKNYTPSVMKINSALKEWAEKRNYSIIIDKAERTLSGVHKCRKFLENAPF